MCGICGVVDWRGREVDIEEVIRMRDVMASRGPDDIGLYAEPSVVLGHRRLSVIDLGKTGHQPMPNEDKNVWVLVNGEIYNFPQLRVQLETTGHHFVGKSDTEVLVHSYEQWGLSGMIQRIVGMFALAIWDKRTRELHLVRDHIGKKPIFYRLGDGRLWFSSDLKSIWLASGSQLTIDEKAVDEFFYYTFISQQRTIYRGVHKLPPGSWITFGGRSTPLQKQYWRPDYTRKIVRPEGEYIEGIDYYLRQAVRRRLIADVPLGGFLSGGVDSSIVCALMASEGDQPPRTFSVGFDDASEFDERPFSRIVAQHIRSYHTELVVKPEITPILSRLVWHYGEPFGDSSSVPTYLISQEARKHVKVVLTGDGGDEAFAGYSRQRRADYPYHYSYLPALVRKSLIPTLAGITMILAPRTLFARNFDLFAKYLNGDNRALAASTSWFDSLRSDLYSDEFKQRLSGFHPLKDRRLFLNGLTGPTFVDKALEYIFLTTLPSDYLVKLDVATMAHSLEARCPFLDKDLLEFIMSIPGRSLVLGNRAKAVLKKYAECLIPNEVIYRKKHGFSIPIKQWFRGQWQQPLESLLLSKQSLERGYFRPQTVQKVLREHATGKRNHVERIWTLLIFEIWNRLFVDRTMEPGDPVLVYKP